MADEQRIVGMPAGSGNSGGSQVAAGFKVDSSSLQQLHKVWRQLIQDVKDFNKELGQINDKRLTALGASVSGGAQGLGTGQSYTATHTPATTMNAPGTSVTASRGALPAPPSGGGAPAAARTSVNWGRAGAAGGAVALLGAGSYMRDHLQNIVSLDRWAQQTAQSQPGQYQGGAKASYIRTATSQGSAVNAQDFFGGQSSLEGTFGMGLAGTGFGRGVMNQANQAGNLLGSYSAGASAISGLGTPQAFWSLQRLGIQTRAPGGKFSNPQDIAQQIVQRVYGKQVNAQVISQGMAAGAPLSNVLNQLGFNSDTQDYIARLAMAKSQGGSGVNLNTSKNGRMAGTSANKAAGLGDSIYDAQRGLSNAQFGMEGTATNDSTGALEFGFKKLTTATDDLNTVMEKLGKTFGAIGTGSMFGGGVLGGIAGSGGGILQWLVADLIAGKVRSGGGLGGLLRRGGSPTGTVPGTASPGGATRAAGAFLPVAVATAASYALGNHLNARDEKRNVSAINSAGKDEAIRAVKALKGWKQQAMINELTRTGHGDWLVGLHLPGDGQSGGAGGGGGGGQASTGPSGSGVLGIAEKYLGTAYQWGGSSPATGFDCSGLTQFSYAQVGINLPRTSQQQEHSGVEVSRENAGPGDLVFYGEPAYHVGIYMGGGKMLDAPHTGANVRIENLWGGESHFRRVGGGSSTPVGGGASGGSTGNAGATKTSSLTPGRGSGAGGLAGNFGSTDVASAYATLIAGGTVGGGLMGGSKTTTSTTNGASSSGASGSTQQMTGNAVQIGKQMAAQRGWTGSEWDALYQLWQHESNWDPKAKNPSSGAYGIPQSLPGNKMASAGSDWQTNAATQIKWGLDYIAGRPDYGSPSKAWSLWQSRSPHWYRTGTYQTEEGPAYLHDDEMVLPAAPANAFRQYAAKRKQYEIASPNLGGGKATRGGATTIHTMTINAPIHMPSANLSASDMRNYLNGIKAAMAEDDLLSQVGTG